MSVSKWAYTPEKCDRQPCVGDCDLCSKKDVLSYSEIKRAVHKLEEAGNAPVPDGCDTCYIASDEQEADAVRNGLESLGIKSVKVITADDYYARMVRANAE